MDKKSKKISKQKVKKNYQDYEETDDGLADDYDDDEETNLDKQKRCSAAQKHVLQITSLFLKYYKVKHCGRLEEISYDKKRNKDILKECKFDQVPHYDYIKNNLLKEKSGKSKNEDSSITKIEQFRQHFIEVDDIEAKDTDILSSKTDLKNDFKEFMNSKYYTIFICDVYQGETDSKIWLIKNKTPLFTKFFDKNNNLPFYPIDLSPDVKKDEFLMQYKSSIISDYDKELKNIMYNS